MTQATGRGGLRVAVEAVIFDWGGTLTPWRNIDPGEEWRSLAAAVSPEQPDDLAQRLMAAAEQAWGLSRVEHRSTTFDEICRLAGVTVSDEHAMAYRAFWDHATYIDPDVPELFERLRASGHRIGVLSNTIWPRHWHEEIFERDRVLHLLDGAVYTSEIPWTKPSPQAFLAAMEAVGVHEPSRCVFVGDRRFDDIYGAKNAGMRAVLLPHSDIPAGQIGHTEGDPDAIIQRLADLPDTIADW
jgi:putative hydrolase of the HAD superfamily